MRVPDEQQWFEPVVVCLTLRDTEDSQKGTSCSHLGVKEQRQRQEFLWHLWTAGDGWNYILLMSLFVYNFDFNYKTE